ncbi:Na+/melibiose symporter [Thermoanaerobacter thermohydrosulfuricus]|uniref:Na+/melibiose symporter n=1 Tax=Thermoanaerobacter thermohydrosulfuricus TaxID=1516 RepID=A0A1G7RM19_THETY|nr:Na+/melibiose symporter [Thermoanaerobacter thermohydrosulfuricus]
MENKEIKNNENNNIKILGWVAFFGGLSQDMIVPILPTFYTQILGLSKEMVGLIEGSVTTVVSLMRMISGIISDKIGKRKSIVFIGYLFSAVGRVLLPLTNGAAMAFGLRLIDGIGKGTKDAPRDALVAKSSKIKNMGFSFGFQRMLDTLGSFLGPLITAGLMLLFAKYIDSIKFRLIFLIAGLVAFITIILIGLFVVEQKGERISSSFKLDLSVFKGKFLLFFIVMLVFTLGNSSDAFLILRARSVGVSESTIPIIIAMFNLFYALLSVPSGVLSDKIGRVNVIRLGWIIYAVTYLGFALAKLPWHIWVLYAIYGVYYSTTEGVAKSLVAHIVDDSNRGTAFGLYNASMGLLALPASFIAGYLWDKASPAAPFYFGALCSIMAVVLITLFKIEKS